MEAVPMELESMKTNVESVTGSELSKTDCVQALFQPDDETRASINLKVDSPSSVSQMPHLTVQKTHTATGG